mmetsp:Transcript_26545/g.48120  ORF Transcript_26545/g.48120 Transcript_26545/m.48120 type:complete len:238 (+) Transcript_26545:392-1105(+)
MTLLLLLFLLLFPSSSWLSLLSSSLLSQCPPSIASRTSRALGLSLQSPSAPSSPNDPFTGFQFTISFSSCHMFIVGVMCSSEVTSIGGVRSMGRREFKDFVLCGVQFLRPIGARNVTFCLGGGEVFVVLAVVVLFSTRGGGVIFTHFCFAPPPPSSSSSPHVSISRTARPAHAPHAACGPPPPIVTCFASASSSSTCGLPYLSSMIFPMTIILKVSSLFSFFLADKSGLLRRRRSWL